LRVLRAMNHKRHRPKRQRAGCTCNGKIGKHFKRRYPSPEIRRMKETAKEQGA
jgi:hypothetical protein